MRTTSDAFLTIAHETKNIAEKSKKPQLQMSACPQMDFEEGDI